MKFPVMEQFYTIQGEGKYTGHPAYFIRLAGCDVGCVWCDVKDSWDATGYPTLTAEEIVKEVTQHPCNIVVITGGEPAMYDLTELTSAIKAAGKRVHIETSGAHPLRGEFDWVTFSPKKFKAPIPEAASQADELKVIIFNKSDFEWAQTYQPLVPNNCSLYLQPEWSKRDQVQPLMVDFILSNPEWQIGLQTHKYLGID
jgi:7-carboxy-7-deazaguanine synthase